MDLDKAIVVHYGEVGLKGQNRPEFVAGLVRNIRAKLDAHGRPKPVQALPGLLKIACTRDATAEELETITRLVCEVFGVAWAAPAFVLGHRGFSGDAAALDEANLEAAVTAVAGALPVPEAGFAVRVRRGDKRLPFCSNEMERRLGAVILKRTAWKKVNLTDPEMVLEVDFRGREVFIYTRRVRGHGGLPVGMTGRVLGLFSGGIDSPVAMWLMGKRGCTVDLLHFSISEPTEAEVRQSKIYRLAAVLARWLITSRLHVVPYTYFDLELLKTPTPYALVLFRRFMLRVAQKLAAQTGAQALVTGDNLAQVASQTLSNLVTTTEAVQIPVFRPLLCFDKTEIIELARQIGTYPISVEPYKDCCALVDRHPKTRSDPGRIRKIEAEVFPDYDALVDKTLAGAVTIDVREAGVFGATGPQLTPGTTDQPGE